MTSPVLPFLRFAPPVHSFPYSGCMGTPDSFCKTLLYVHQYPLKGAYGRSLANPQKDSGASPTHPEFTVALHLQRDDEVMVFSQGVGYEQSYRQRYQQPAGIQGQVSLESESRKKPLTVGHCK